MNFFKEEPVDAHIKSMGIPTERTQHELHFDSSIQEMEDEYCKCRNACVGKESGSEEEVLTLADSDFEPSPDVEVV